MTKREMFNAAIAVIEGREVEVDRVELIEGLSHEIELLDARKNSKSKGMTKTQKANEVIMAVIADVLIESGEKMTVTEMLSDERLSGYTNQKISALLRLMIKEGRVDKTVEGKKAYFAAVTE